MPLSNEQKEVLRERMKIAREAKLAKKQAVKEVVEEVKEVEKPKPVELKPAPVKEIPFEEPLPSARIVKNKSPKAKADKPAKTKYAKLVFYQEPTAKKMKKLSKVLEDSSSDDEEVKVKTPAPTVKLPAAVEAPPPVDYRKQRMENLNKMSKLFFD